VACYGGYYINTTTNICSLGNALCASFGINGVCASCYSGYSVSGTICVLSSLASNIYCSTFVSSVCTACYGGYYINTTTNICTLGNALCVSFAVNGACASCFAGYTLSGTICVLSTSIYDPECSAHSGSVCTACYGGYYVNSSGVCVLANPLCASLGVNGVCTSCYAGYVLSGTTCAVPVVSYDPYCSTHSGSACTACYAGYYVSSSGVCSLASPWCATYAMIGGNCLSCPNGYSLSSGKCTLFYKLLIYTYAK
jgi:hypothetical protein